MNTDGAFLVRTTAPGAGLTVAQPVTVADGGSLSLSAAGALAINTDVVAKGAVPVALAYDRNTTTPAPTDLSFAQGRSLRFANADGSAATAAVTGQALTINGTGYTLVYTMGQLAGIGLGDRVALATDLFATSDGTAGGTPKTYTTAVIAGGTTSTTAPTAFSGTLEGLGHTVSNLTIDGGSNNFVGLIGYATGTVRDIGLLGGSVKGRGEVGGLVGYNSGGTVAQAYATGAVSGTGYVGGLVGYNDQGTIVQAYATGAVSGSEDHVGGLVSVNDSGKVTQSYATGPVAGRDFVGGLIGLNDGGTVRQTYATGAVSGSSYVGGLIGASNGTVAQSYWDTQTSGRTDSFGGTGLTTAQLQSGSASGLGSAFAGGTNGLYPYLKSFFPAGVQAITGTAQTADGGALAGARIDIYTGGNPVGGTLVSGANGYVYQPVAAGTLPASGSVQIGASLTPRGGSAVTGLTYTDGATLSGPVLALGSITAGQNRQTTARTLASALPSDLDATFGSGPLATLRTALANTPLIVTATGASFILDQALTASANVTLVTTGSAAPLTLGANLDVGAGNTLTLTAAGAIDQTGGTITAGTLTGSSGGAATLTQTGNAIATLGPFSAGGALSLATAQALTVAGTVSAGQTLSLTSSGDLTLASGAQVRAAGDIALATSGAFVNDAGGGAVSSSGGRWLIYSANAAGDTFGGLDSGNTAVWNTAAGGAVTQSGNRYVFAEQPTLTVTTTDLTKTYGQDAAASVADAYTLTGLRPAGAGAYRADTAATALPAGQLVTSAGSGAQADVARSPYAIVADFTGLTSPAGYALSAVNAGHLTVNPATIAVSGVTGVTKTYDGTAALPAGASGVAVSGVLFGDAVDVSAASAAYDGANAGSHAVLVSGLALTGAKAGNYQLSATAVTGSGTIDPAALTITAADRTKTYGQTLDLGSTGFTAAGILGTDAVTGVGLSSAGAAAAADVAGGPYAITAANAQGTGLANYAITYRPGLLTVTPATLTVTGATGVNKTYDGTAALPAKASGVAVSGVLFGDAVDVSAASAAYDGANAGSRAVLVSGLALTGAKAGNYQLSATAVTGSGTIDPAALTYTANAATRAYGAANPTLTGTVSGFVNGENQSGATTGTLAFTTGATPGSDVGRYAVTGSGLTAVNGNYVFVQAVGNETALGITPVPITVTANSGRSIYGDSPVDPGWSATGLQNGQGVDVLTGLSSGFGLTAATAAGRYALAVSGTLSNGNYVVTARNPGGFIIDPRPITITADAQTRLYGDANPSLTYTVGGRGLVDGDALTGTLATMATGTSAIGSYAITQGTLAASPDYAVTYRGAVLTVTARSITPTVDAQTQAPSSAGPTPTSTVGGRGLADGDAVSGGQAATTATRTSGVAADTTAQGSPTDSAGTAVVSQAASSDTSRAGEAAAGATIQETPVPVANAVAGSQADLRVTPASIVPTNLANSLVRDVLTAGQPAEIILTRAADGTLMLSNSRFDGTRVCLSEAGGCFAVPLGTAPGPQASATDTLSAR
ncbi:hypothetical protein FVE89_13750 [Methylobacterium sp. 2A]|uniref:MBG domain-containing protein n=1 Tax=Methylobacterium sp. 2A TaxID=2603816 RepID=UPI001353FE57|nr:hypothetical protein [Methylobacterium sp. 2A]